MPEHEKQMLDGIYANFLRRTLGIPPPFLDPENAISNASLFQKYDLVRWSTRLKKARVGLFTAITRKGPDDPGYKVLFGAGSGTRASPIKVIPGSAVTRRGNWLGQIARDAKLSVADTRTLVHEPLQWQIHCEKLFYRAK